MQLSLQKYTLQIAIKTALSNGYHTIVIFMQLQGRLKDFDLKASKGYWNNDKDKKLLELVKMYGGKLSWNQLSKAFPGIKGKHIRQRYRNHLDPNLKQFAWTWEEDQILKRCYVKYGNSWELISKHLPGRSSNQIKNRVKRRQFRDLFQKPRPATPKYRLKPTIAQQQRAIQLKKEQNLREIQKQLILQQKKQVVQDLPIPQSLLILAEQQKKKKMSKQHKLQITSLHLIRTYLLIRENIAKKQRSDFYLIFQKKTRRQIFAKIQDMHWTIDQLWPLVTNRPVRQSFDQEIAFFLYCLIKADNKLSNKIVHRILKCSENEDYLMRKVEFIINDIDNFIKLELKIMKEKQLHEQFNRKDVNLKINLEEEDGKERLRRIKFENSQKREKNDYEAVIIDGECAIPVSMVNKVKDIVTNQDDSIANNEQSQADGMVKILQGISTQKRIAMVKTQESQLPQQIANNHQTSKKGSSEEEAISMQNNFDWMILGKQVRIGNQLNSAKLKNKQSFKIQHADNKNITKRQGQGLEKGLKQLQKTGSHYLSKLTDLNNIGFNSTNQSEIYNSFNELSIKAVTLEDYNYEPDLDQLIIDEWQEPEMNEKQKMEIEDKQDQYWAINENSGQMFSDPSNSSGSPNVLNQKINQDIYHTESFMIQIQQLDSEQLQDSDLYEESYEEESRVEIQNNKDQSNQYSESLNIQFNSKRPYSKSQSQNLNEEDQDQYKSFKTKPSVILQSYYMKKIQNSNQAKLTKRQNLQDQDLSPMNPVKIQQSPLWQINQNFNHSNKGEHQTWYTRFRHKLLQRLVISKQNPSKIEQQ